MTRSLIACGRVTRAVPQAHTPEEGGRLGALTAIELLERQDVPHELVDGDLGALVEP